MSSIDSKAPQDAVQEVGPAERGVVAAEDPVDDREYIPGAENSGDRYPTGHRRCHLPCLLHYR